MLNRCQRNPNVGQISTGSLKVQSVNLKSKPEIDHLAIDKPLIGKSQVREILVRAGGPPIVVGELPLDALLCRHPLEVGGPGWFVDSQPQTVPG